MPGISVLRLMRAFRVFRLFKRIESLNKILKALGNAFPPMFNAFVLVLLILAIFSIMAVNFYSGIPDPYVSNLFGNFFNAMFTMWQIATKSEWMAIVRDELMPYQPAAGTAILFTFFILIIDQVLLNVVVATLLENFTNMEGNQEGAQLILDGSKTDIERYDPLMGLFDELNKAHHLDDLEFKIRMIFIKLLGEESSQNHTTARLKKLDMRHGLLQFDVLPPAIFYERDWQRLVVDRGFDDGIPGSIGLMGFMKLLKIGLSDYWKRKVSKP